MVNSFEALIPARSTLPLLSELAFVVDRMLAMSAFVIPSSPPTEEDMQPPVGHVEVPVVFS